MGLIATVDLLWLAETTGDSYWRERAEDGVFLDHAVHGSLPGRHWL